MSWTTQSETVRQAALDPRVAQVLACADANCAAIVQRKAETFMAGHTKDFVVNSPANRVLKAEQIEEGFATGLIDYHSLERRIDFAGVLPEGLIVIMGEETAMPRGRAHHAGKTIKRRFTDLWRSVDGSWRVAVRQATVTHVA